MKKLLLLLSIISLSLTLSACKKTTPDPQTQSIPQEQTQLQQETAQNQPITFTDPKKSAHYVSNTPTHGQTLKTAPIVVTIKFNFDLAKPSSISITQNGTDYGQGDTNIGNDKLTLTRSVDPEAPAGLYTVNYTACWPDATCHDGNFQFAISK